MLDKYKKLANDAHMNGDRVNAEYYLQFADHYFRVLADNRNRQEETQRSRSDYREQSSFEGVGPDYDMRDEGDDIDGGDSDSGDMGYSQGGGSQNNGNQNNGNQGNGRESATYQQRDTPRRNGNDRGNADRGNTERGNADRGNGRSNDRYQGERNVRPEQQAEVETIAPEVKVPSEERRPRRPRRDAPPADTSESNTAGFDTSILPPAIGAADDVAAKPKRTIVRRPRKVAEELGVAEAEG